ncbi:type II toxin-antitoxin system RelE/ParE family toxin [Kribbella sp. NPDC058693]|uniref:type II toxin-antitoxin system RelE family toxin n=1 Tax=Kribbella sp. NPDC058693 TaxID=3346602 RepID=UPI0036524F44
MTYEVIWSERALDQAAGFLKDDAEGLAQLFASVDLLADDPRPAGTAEYGTPDRRRLRSGRYRVLYDVNDSTVTVVVIHAGRSMEG